MCNAFVHTYFGEAGCRHSPTASSQERVMLCTFPTAMPPSWMRFWQIMPTPILWAPAACLCAADAYVQQPMFIFFGNGAKNADIFTRIFCFWPVSQVQRTLKPLGASEARQFSARIYRERKEKNKQKCCLTLWTRRSLVAKAVGRTLSCLDSLVVLACSYWGQPKVTVSMS